MRVKDACIQQALFTFENSRRISMILLIALWNVIKLNSDVSTIEDSGGAWIKIK